MGNKNKLNVYICGITGIVAVIGILVLNVNSVSTMRTDATGQGIAVVSPASRTMVGCVDSDNDNPMVQGIAYEGIIDSSRDLCDSRVKGTGNIVTERFCSSKTDEVISKLYNCYYGCIDGACIDGDGLDYEER